MSHLIRGLSDNGGVVFCGIDSTEIVRTAEKLHTTSATCSAALGRLLTGAALMGSMLKDDRDTITLRVSGNGPAGVVIGIIRDKLNSDACRNGFILDGFPRSIPQAEALDAMGVKMDAVLSLEVPDETIIQRMSGRRVCRCGASYHVVYLPPKQDNLCDKCGDTLYIRDDDAEETVRKRLETYHAQTEPLKAFYAAKGILITVQGREDVEDTTADVFAALAGVQ